MFCNWKTAASSLRSRKHLSQGSYRNPTVDFRTFPGQNYLFFHTSQGILFIFMCWQVSTHRPSSSWCASLAASPPADSLQGGRNCFWLCPRHRPSPYFRDVCAGRWHLWAVTPPFGWTLRHAGSSDQDPVRLTVLAEPGPTELPCCNTRRLELAAYTPALNLRQSWTVQRWVEDPSLHTGLRIPLRTFV